MGDSKARNLTEKQEKPRMFSLESRICFLDPRKASLAFLWFVLAFFGLFLVCLILYIFPDRACIGLL